MPEFITRIRKRANNDGFDNVIVVKASQTEPGLPDNAIDLAFACDVIHHLEQPETYLAGLHEAIKPGGELVVVETHRADGSHVARNRDQTLALLREAGFELDHGFDLLEKHYVLRLRRPAAGS